MSDTLRPDTLRPDTQRPDAAGERAERAERDAGEVTPRSGAAALAKARPELASLEVAPPSVTEAPVDGDPSEGDRPSSAQATPEPTAELEERKACPSCGASILLGARKCKACKAWLGPRPVTTAPASLRSSNIAPRATVIVATAVLVPLLALVSSRESRVAEAPPLTDLAGQPASTGDTPKPGAIGPEPEPEVKPPLPDVSKRWKSREIMVPDVHPLDLAWNASGSSLFVSADDATLREYGAKEGELLHQASVPATGDHIRVLGGGRWVAVLRHTDAARIPVMDTSAWDRDPMLLDVGSGPGDIVELNDGTVITSTLESKRLARFDLKTGTRLADLTLPHATGQLFLVRAEGRPYVAAVGSVPSLVKRAGGQGAWVDLFDPNERPFGATRRSIAVGREPRQGAVSRDGSFMLLPDFVSGTATLYPMNGTSEVKPVAVGQKPIAVFLLNDDRHAITLDTAGGTATVVSLGTMKVLTTLSLGGTPQSGAVSPDGKTLFVSLGGAEWPPRGSGVAVLGGDPPRLLQTLPTGQGASAVAVSRDGRRAAIASYWSKSITILEQ